MGNPGSAAAFVRDLKALWIIPKNKHSSFSKNSISMQGDLKTMLSVCDQLDRQTPILQQQLVILFILGIE